MAATVSDSGIGVSVLRKEDAPLITGQGRYVDDIKLPNMAHAAFLRSPHAHAVIRGIDTSAAEAMPGVVDIFTYDTLGLEAGVPCASNPFGNAKQPKRPILADGKVRMVGELVAVVVAETAALARDAADRIVVDYDPLPVVIDAENAGKPGCAAVARGGARQPLPDDRAQDRGLRRRLRRRAREGLADDRQSAPHRGADRAARRRGRLDLLERRAHVLHVDAGAALRAHVRVRHLRHPRGQGARRSRPTSAAASARRSTSTPRSSRSRRSRASPAGPSSGSRPAPSTWSRRWHGRDQLQTATLAADDDGRMLALRVHLLQDCGAYLGLLTPSIAHLTVIMVPGAYALEHVDITLDEVFTNTTPTDAYRGAGRPEAAHLVERLVDRLADELGKDPAELRRLNFATEFPYTTATGLLYDSGDYAAALDKALELSDYAGFEARRSEAAARGNYRGIGLSTWVEICGLAPSAVTKAIGIGAGGWESAIVRLHPTGSATVVTGSSAHGQGHETSWSQIVESELGIPFDQVDVVHGDTGQSPYGLGTYGSRSLAVGGTALQLTCGKVRDKARLIAAHLLECCGRRPRVVGHAVAGQGLARARQDHPGAGLCRLGRRFDARGRRAEPRGYDVLRPAELHVPVRHAHRRGRDRRRDRQDRRRALHGGRRLRQRDQSDDRGGQVHGGIAQSIAQALYEETVYDESGQILTGTLVEYMIPSAAELPRFETARTVTPSPSNPLGVKGIGEAGTIAASAAVVNAAVDALSGIGVRHLEMPMQPGRVWEAIQQAKAGN